MSNDELTIDFNKAMYEIHRKAKVEAGYNASVFLRMLQDRGPLETAQFLIHTNRPSDGFTALWERHRLDLTVEAYVLQDRFEQLFTDEDRETCRQRLLDYGYSRPESG